MAAQSRALPQDSQVSFGRWPLTRASGTTRHAVPFQARAALGSGDTSARQKLAEAQDGRDGKAQLASRAADLAGRRATMARPGLAC